jgi:ElaB/YqjD/DUF883 family membrane-anchored ribosome-binding protein
MELEDYSSLEGEPLKEAMRALGREELDAQFQRLGGQRAQLSQRLEALYSPDRLDRFLAIRSGDLAQIDEALKETGPANPKERTLLTTYREFNRVLLAFMDVYEERVLEDLRDMSKEELETINANLDKHIAETEEALKRNPDDIRKAQDASGTFRLVGLMKGAIRRELRQRFGAGSNPSSEE